jgi:hypothetical protein
MFSLLKSSRASQFVFYIVVIFVAIVSWKSQAYMQKVAEQQLSSQRAGGWVIVDKLTDVQTKQLDAYLELNRLLTTLGTTLMGAVLFLMFDSNRKLVWKGRWWAALLGVLFVSVSIFCGLRSVSFFPLGCWRDSSNYIL